MYIIYFNSETRTFGVHSDRVRDSVLKMYKSKYGKDSDKYKDFKERKELLDELESRKDESSRPYGYAASPNRVTDFTRTHYRGNLPKGTVRSENDRNSVSKNKVFKRHRDDTENAFINKLFDKYNRMNKRSNKNLKKFRDGERIITPELLQILKDSIGESRVTESDEINSMASGERVMDNDGIYKLSNLHVNVNPNGSDYEAPHEMQHILNILYGDNNVSRFNTLKLNKRSHARNSKALMDSNQIQDYIHYILEEELSANRARTMIPWKFSHQNLTDEMLKRSYDEGKAAQATYNARIGGYNPLSLRYNMDPEALENLKRNKEDAGIVDEIIKPVVTGHIDLNRSN